MKIFFRILLVLAIVVFAVLVYAYNEMYGESVDLPDSEQFTFIYLPSDAEYDQVLDSILPHVKRKESFKLIAELKKYPSLFKPGKYKIENNWSNIQLVDHLRSGNQQEVKLVFNFANTIEDVAGIVALQIEADSADIVNKVMDQEFIKANGFDQYTIPSLFIPNTYHFYWNSDADTFIKRMLKEYNSFWNSSRLQKAANLKLDKFEVTTLATIVQKETAAKDERPKVAGLYINRLKNNWRLESDPTVIYAMKQKDENIKVSRVLYADLDIESPYNTYRNRGLPPGPISIAEISSIDAVLNHEKHSYFFMCASPDNLGYHNFAKSLAQHRKNARKWQKYLNERDIKR
jgi:UPF0755 protein